MVNNAANNCCAKCGDTYWRREKWQIICRECFWRLSPKRLCRRESDRAYNDFADWVSIYAELVYGKNRRKGITRRLARELIKKIHPDIIGPIGHEATALVVANMERGE